MKSYFSRILHHTLSHSDVKSQSAPMLSLSDFGDASTPSLSPSGLTRWSRSNQVANLFHLDTPIKSECDTIGTDTRGKPEYDKIENIGRSMVEMLGVLAIIGVLSVGAISGYSKAMMKYKLNKLTSEYNYIIAALLEHEDDLRKLKDKNAYQENYYLVEIMNKLNMIPSSWKIKDKDYLIDSTGCTVIPFIRAKRINFDIYFSEANPSITQSFANDVCFEFFKSIALPSHNSIYYVTLWKSGGNSIKYYGDMYCKIGTKCLSNMTMSEIHDVCNSCSVNKEKCVFNIQI